MGLLVIVFLILLIMGGIPVAPWGGWHEFGWGPSGLGLILLVVILVILFSGRW